MSLESKRKIFFIIVGLVFCILFALVFLPPCLEWADGLTLAGVMVFGIFPFSQFLLIGSAFFMGLLVIVLFNVDTKILVHKSDKPEAKPGPEPGPQGKQE